MRKYDSLSDLRDQITGPTILSIREYENKANMMSREYETLKAGVEKVWVMFAKRASILYGYYTVDSKSAISDNRYYPYIITGKWIDHSVRIVGTIERGKQLMYPVMDLYDCREIWQKKHSSDVNGSVMIMPNGCLFPVKGNSVQIESIPVPGNNVKYPIYPGSKNMKLQDKFVSFSTNTMTGIPFMQIGETFVTSHLYDRLSEYDERTASEIVNGWTVNLCNLKQLGIGLTETLRGVSCLANNSDLPSSTKL